MQFECLSFLKDQQHQQQQKEIASKSSFLHFRAVIEKCEHIFRWKPDLKRRELWIYIFKDHYLINKEDKDIFPRLSPQDLANQVVNLYDTLSSKVHKSFRDDVNEELSLFDFTHVLNFGKIIALTVFIHI